MKVNIQTHNFTTTVFINGKVHVSFKHYRGVQTYIDSQLGVFCVEWHLKDTIIKCEYEDKKKWNGMLKAIKKWL